MKSETEADKMGTNFRKMAKEMKVSSTEIATAAVTFYRQGLDDSAVNERLEWVTKYAKVANIAFDEAAELVTAATNSMSADIQGDVQRVVDVFLYLGDAAATSGEEIGKAMQKASASATQFGLSFEWLGAYIATVSEQTRQAPESIGNAFNTMMARMHSIKQNGFNSEDETKINDVAKALKGIDVQLMDSEGNWRKMSDIYADIADKWGELDDKQKSYIATTMAGTRQQNVFFALMNDMSKGLENGSRAWELYNGAMEAAGSATEKYAIWEESVAAAQGSLQASLESLYATLVNGEAIKTFYDILTGIVDGLNNLGGIGPIVVAVIGAIAATIVVMGHSAAVAAGETLTLAAAGQALSTAFSAHPVMLFATILLTLIGALGGVGAILDLLPDKAKQFDEALSNFDKHQTNVEKLKTLQENLGNSFDKVMSGAQMSAIEMSAYNSLLDQAAQISPNAKQAVDQLREGYLSEAEALAILNGELEKRIKHEEDLSMSEARKALNSISVNDDLKQNGQASSAFKRLEEYGYTGDNDSLGGALRNFQRAYSDMSERSRLQWKDLYVAMGKAKKLAFPNNDFHDNQESWGLVGTYLWSELYGDGGPEQYQKELEAELDRWTEITLQCLGNIDPIMRGIAQKQIKNIIMGEDGEIDYFDFSEKTRTSLQKYVNGFLAEAANALKEAPTEEMYQEVYDSFGFDASKLQFAHSVDFDEMGNAVYE